MNRRYGPLTERQRDILELVTSGLRHKEVAPLVRYTRQRVTDPEPVPVHGVDEGVVRAEMIAINGKFKARTTAETVRIYATALAYRAAAEGVLAVRHPHPVGDRDLHVNHVLEGIARLFYAEHDQRMPK